MPRSIAASTVRRRARVPARWPSATVSPCSTAQRLLPSMMIATDRGSSTLSLCRTSARSGSRRRRRRAKRPNSDFRDLGFLALQELVDPADVVVGQLLDAVFRAVLLVGPDALLLLEVVDDVAADIPNRDATLLRDLPRDLHELLPPLLGELRDRQPDDLPVVGRVEAEVGLLDRALDGRQRARIKRLDGQHPRLRDVDRRELVQRCLLAVILHGHAVEERRGCASRADRVQLVMRGLDGLVHPGGCVPDEVVDHVLAPVVGVEMIVPTRSPSATRLMLPSASAKT